MGDRELRALDLRGHSSLRHELFPQSRGGAYVEVTWSEYVCQFEEWSTDDGSDDWSDDGGEDDDYAPCSDGSCDPTGGDEPPR